MNNILAIDFKNALKENLGAGISQEEVNNLKPRLNEVKQRFLSESLGFRELPYDFENLKQDLDRVEELTKEFNTIVIIGIGGSDLGTRAIHRALNHQYYNEQLAISNEQLKNRRKVYFAGDTTDPEAISDLVDILDLSKTVFFVVSKSGNTVEQGSTFIFFRDLVKQKLGEEEITKHFIFLTDSSRGLLHDLSVRAEYSTIDIPSDVGGRFSVLSSVGMIPAHLLGLNVEELLNGAKELNEFLKSPLDFSLPAMPFGRQAGRHGQDDIILNYVALQYLYYKSGHDISVLMPYQYSLYEFSKWFQQLWAESLGKDGEGITPIATLGPTDQHSQLQLYNDGPNNKLITFLVAEESRKNLNLPEDYSAVEEFEFLKGKNFHQILGYELAATASSLSKNQRPNLTIKIPKVNEFYLGQLFYFFEVAVVCLAYLMNVNPFDQPGVEESKRLIYERLKESK